MNVFQLLDQMVLNLNAINLSGAGNMLRIVQTIENIGAVKDFLTKELAELEELRKLHKADEPVEVKTE